MTTITPLKTIGLIGGLSWESSAEYYRIINEATRDRLGEFYSARILMFSVNFAEIEQYQHLGQWDLATQVMIDAAQRLERGGADFILILSNTMHRMADELQQHISIPLLHIADPTGQAIREQNITKIGLLGTAFTMEGDFYKRRLQDQFGLEVLTPDAEDRAIVHRVIYEELVRGKVFASSREQYKRIIGDLVERGAQGVILGCTEIMLLVQQEDSRVPLFDTTTLHALAAVERSLKGN
ncbi:aspartate/glutamate racemase family protein [Dyadobacter luticola]|uniref:Aspartate/glutamate racemase family protein n=1 Tax=Dyadobacter luticola TaxID=1979387 RepID=A0A5R9L254_9BACT|nr:aspartate/glutamate racemase family protein [Dyadobacter luticola]TLV02467.1 aspartate/glutamate racemase family protein [Dyadobacter luticola]